MKKEGKDVFVEMLRLIAKRQSDILSKQIIFDDYSDSECSDCENDDNANDDVEEFYCFYCNADFNSKQGVIIHIRSCKDK